jgi:DNA-binding NtrC family response regulator
MPDEDSSMERQTILFIEDDVDQREPNAEALESAGYRVLQAENWEHALALTRERSEQVGLIVTDLVMHDAAGIGAFSKLRQKHGGVPVIVLSGYPRVMRLLEGVLDGVVDWLQKPVDVDAVVEAVKRVIGRE